MCSTMEKWIAKNDASIQTVTWLGFDRIAGNREWIAKNDASIQTVMWLGFDRIAFIEGS